MFYADPIYQDKTNIIKINTIKYKYHQLVANERWGVFDLYLAGFIWRRFCKKEYSKMLYYFLNSTVIFYVPAKEMEKRISWSRIRPIFWYNWAKGDLKMKLNKFLFAFNLILHNNFCIIVSCNGTNLLVVWILNECLGVFNNNKKK